MSIVCKGGLENDFISYQRSREGYKCNAIASIPGSQYLCVVCRVPLEDHRTSSFLCNFRYQQGAMAKNIKRERMAVLRLETIMQVMARRL